MNPTIGWIRQLAESWGVPAVLVPLVPFLVLLIVLYAVIGLAAYGARRKWPRADKTIAFWLFISPWLIGFLIFTVGPMLSSIFVSLTSWDLITPPKFVGVANYTEAFQDPRVGQAIKVTLLYAVISVPLQTVLAFMVSLLMNVDLPGIRLFRDDLVPAEPGVRRGPDRAVPLGLQPAVRAGRTTCSARSGSPGRAGSTTRRGHCRR